MVEPIVVCRVATKVRAAIRVDGYVVSNFIGTHFLVEDEGVCSLTSKLEEASIWRRKEDIGHPIALAFRSPDVNVRNFIKNADKVEVRIQLVKPQGVKCQKAIYVKAEDKEVD